MLDGGFYVGLHHPNHAQHFDTCCISVNRLRDRVSDFPVDRWILDSGAFTEVVRFGGYRWAPSEYADRIRRWATNGNLRIAVSQDYMCEKIALNATGLTKEQHQQLTVERYDALIAENLPVPVMPVLQGYDPQDYVSHIQQYGSRLGWGQWVGVGSVCKRNADIGAIEEVISAVIQERPDLRLHGFGLKLTAFKSSMVRDLLYSADSMAWSFSARRKNGYGANDWREADAFVAKVWQSETFDD